jgi:molecular chaperone HscB
MNLNLQASDFELFGVPEQFDQQPVALDVQWKALLREAHPDRFAAQGAAAQRLAMQWSVRINEAHQRLKDPLKRASYLCERWGAPVNAERNTAMPTAFLMQQMAWREELEEAQGDVDALEVLLTRTRAARQQLLQSVAQSLGDDAGPSRLERAQVASGHVRAMMFVERFSDEINQRLVQLES